MIRIILCAFCAEDYTYLTVYQELVGQGNQTGRVFVRSQTATSAGRRGVSVL